MANEKNLKPASSKSEARERGQKGGQASGEARRKKKAMREMAELVLAAPVPVKNAKLKKQMLNMGFGEDDADVQLMSLLSLALRATKGDLQALQFLRDTAGEKPVENMSMKLEVPRIIDDLGKDDPPEDVDPDG